MKLQKFLVSQKIVIPSPKSCRLLRIKETVVLASKRARKSPEKIQVSKADLVELSQGAQPDVDTNTSEDNESDQGDVSLDEVSENENQQPDINTEDTEASNS